MKVKELLFALADYDPNAEVMICDDEQGELNVRAVTPREIDGQILPRLDSWQS